MKGDRSIELQWKGKAYAQQAASYPAIHKMVHRPDKSIQGSEIDHLYIIGDNLPTLRLLKERYANQIHQVYIDPPYNTGQKFVYQDHQKDRATWLNMMYPRLILARQLLSKHGVIYVSIDDHELASLKLVMDEVFGIENYIDTFSWVKTATPANLSKKSKKVVEYVLCYQKVKDNSKFKGIQKSSPSSNGLLNQTNKKQELIFPAGIVQTKLPDQKLKKGKYGTDKYDIKLLKDTQVKDGVFSKPVHLKAKFKWTQPKLEKEIEAGTQIFIPTIRLSPSYDKTSYAPEVPPNLIDMRVGVDTNETASNNLIQLMGAKVFDFPKPVSLIKYLLGFSDLQNSIILDFFAGSSSTMQAVMEMNQLDGGKRKCICIQSDEAVAAKSAAAEHGYRTIADIGIQRIHNYLNTSNNTIEGIKVFGLDIKDINFDYLNSQAYGRAEEMVGHGLYSRFKLSKADRIAKAQIGCLGELAFEYELAKRNIPYLVDREHFDDRNSDEYDFMVNGLKIDIKVAQKSTTNPPNDKWTYGYPQEQKPESKDIVIVGWVDYDKKEIKFYGWTTGTLIAAQAVVEVNSFAKYKYLTPNHEFKWGILNKAFDELYSQFE